MSVIHRTLCNRGLAAKLEGEWAASPCPNCGGEDRFVFKPCDPKEPWFCRQCGLRGDAIDFLRQFEGLSFPAAVAMLRNEALGGERPETDVFRVDRDLWQGTVASFLYRSQKYLERSNRAQAYLLAERGIRASTARDCGLGFVPEPFSMTRAALGLGQHWEGARQEVQIPSGIVIPIRCDGELVGLQVRRVDAAAGARRYFTLTGSVVRPLICQGVRDGIVIVVESFLCAALTWQEVGRRCTVVAMGSAAARQLGDAAPVIGAADLVLVALDSDGAGAASAHGHWAERNNARRWPVPRSYGKDPTEACRRGLDLETWARAGLRPEDGAEATGWLASLAPRRSAVVHYGARALEVQRAEGTEALKLAFATAPVLGLAIDEGLPQGGEVAILDIPRRRTTIIALSEIGAAPPGLWAGPVVAHGGEMALRRVPGLLAAPRRVSCTALMANALYNDRPTLEELLAREGLEPMPDVFSDAERLAVRAAALPMLHNALRRRLADEGCGRLYRIMRLAQRPIAAMAAAGLPFDREAHAALLSGWRTDHAKLRADLPGLASPLHDGETRRWLSETLPEKELKAWPRTEAGLLAVSDGQLALACNIPAAVTLRECRRLARMIAVYGERFVDSRIGADGRLRGEWTIAGAVTGRLSCHSPNLLAMPRNPEFRALVRATAGQRLLVADVSQMQLRIAAHLAGVEGMLSAYSRGEDLHAATAAALWSIPTENVTTEHRRAAKAANFGLIFGQGVEGFRAYAAREIGVAFSPGDARALRCTWLRRFSAIAQWHRDTATVLADGGKVATAAGRRADAAAFVRNPLQQALAFQVQGTEAEIMLRAATLLHARLRDVAARLALLVHDEVLVEAADDEVTLAAATEAVASSVRDAFREFFPDAAMAGLVEVHAVASWAEAG